MITALLTQINEDKRPQCNNTHLSEFITLRAAFTLRQETLFGADLHEQGLQVGEDLIVGELTDSHGSLGSIHVAHPNHTLSVCPCSIAHGHNTCTAFCFRPTAKQNVLELSQVSRRCLRQDEIDQV